jgi:hypothetical protein
MLTMQSTNANESFDTDSDMDCSKTKSQYTSGNATFRRQKSGVSHISARSKTSRMSRGSRRSRGSRSSRGSNRSRGSQSASQGRTGGRMHPYDGIFGVQQSKIAQGSSKNTIKLSKEDFKEIKWPDVFPLIINDVIEYLTGFGIQDSLRKREEE